MVTKGHLIFINGKTESDSAIGKLIDGISGARIPRICNIIDSERGWRF